MAALREPYSATLAAPEIVVQLNLVNEKLEETNTKIEASNTKLDAIHSELRDGFGKLGKLLQGLLAQGTSRS